MSQVRWAAACALKRLNDKINKSEVRKRKVGYKEQMKPWNR